MQNEENPKEVKIYNPLMEDFEATWFDENDRPHKLVLSSLNITTLPYSQGKFMAKHLTDKVCFERGIKNDHEKWKEILMEVTINDFI
jgi:hypothetical protein